MTLFKTSILSFASTVVKLLAALVINKVIALYIGPTGLALIGQFQNFVQIAMTLAQGGISTGVTKYTAEFGRDSERIPVLFSTASKISFMSSILVGIGIIIFSRFEALHFLGADRYVYIFEIFGLTIVFFVFNNLLLSILNGLKEINSFIFISITQSVYSLLFTSIFVIFMGLDGALISLITNQSIILFIVLYLLRKHKVIKIENFLLPFDQKEARKLIGFTAMAFTSAGTVPVAHLIIRNYIGESIGWEQAGFWQAIWYISTMHLMVFTTTLSTYYLPKLSEMNEKKELRNELVKGYKYLMPIVILSSLTVYFLRNFIIGFLFTKDFAPMVDLFKWQLVGDILKIASWLVAFLMLAKNLSRQFVITELVFSITYIGLSIVLIKQCGLIGVTYAFAINYFLYLITMVKLAQKVLN